MAALVVRAGVFYHEFVSSVAAGASASPAEAVMSKTSSRTVLPFFCFAF